MAASRRSTGHVAWCGRAGVLRGRLLGAVRDHRAAWRASTPSICGLSVEEQAAASRENLYSVAYGCCPTRTRSAAWRGQVPVGAAPKEPPCFLTRQEGQD